MARLFVLGLFFGLALVGCSGPTNRPARMASTRIQEEGNAILVAKNEVLLTGIPLLGPEDESKNGLVLEFETPWEYMRPHMYLVPAGTVVFSLCAGPLKQRVYKFGFHAKAGEAYDLRIEEIGYPMQVTIVEVRTGRVATPGARPKRS